MLIVGCDIGSETHYIRAVDIRGRELGKNAFSFENNKDGFQKAGDWAVRLAAENDKKQIVLGLEPTGHYWFCLAAILTISVLKKGIQYDPGKMLGDIKLPVSKQTSAV